MEVDGYISESCPMAGFSISVVEPSGSTATAAWPISRFK
jgi:hypothetical protein